MALPNPSMVFTPFDPLPASDLNDLVENIESLADGTGFDAGAIDTADIADGAVTAAKTTDIWWEELGRTTLAVAGDTISVTPFAARGTIKVIVEVTDTGGVINNRITFNGDTGANYSYRESINGAADITGAGANFIEGAAVSEAAPFMCEFTVFNIASDEKVVQGSTVHARAAGAATAPARLEFTGKWTNTSNQITRVDITNAGAGDYAIGSKVIILGHD